MYVIVKEQVGAFAIQQQVVLVVRVADYSIPSGLLASIFSTAGQLLGSNDASSPVAIPAPTAEGQILFARLAQTTKMLWESVDLAQLVQTAVKTAAYTAINNDHVLVDASGAGADFEIALPATPTAGNKARVTLVDDHATYKVTIGRNGSLVNGGTSTTALSLVKKGDSVYFEYTGATLGWVTLPEFASGGVLGIANGGTGQITVPLALAQLLSVALPENTAIILDTTLSADGKYSGITETGTAGAALAFGDLVYFAVADSRWELADADAQATAFGKLGICVLAAAGDASPTTILLYGKVRADAVFPALTIGAPVFAGTTAGDIQTTAPSGAADIVRIVGYGNTADELFFCPSPDFFEVA